MDVRRTERVAGDREHERGIDAAGKAEHDIAEMVLADVVAHRRHDRAIHALLHARQRREAFRLDLRRTLPERHVHAGQGFLEGRRAMHDTTACVDRERVAVEHELVLAADEIEVDERHSRLARTKRHVRLAFRLLALLVGRSIQCDADIGSRRARGCGRLHMPDVLADDAARCGCRRVPRRPRILRA